MPKGVNGEQNDDSAENSGAVYVFTRRSGTGTWSQQAYVKASNTGAGDRFGTSVSMSRGGNSLAVGAINEDGGTENSGAVYVFTRSSTTWSQQAYIKASNAGSGDLFGISVSLSNDGNSLAVGAFSRRWRCQRCGWRTK